MADEEEIKPKDEEGAESQGNADGSAESGDPYPSIDLVLKVIPESKSYVDNVRTYLPYLVRGMAKAGMGSANDLIAVLAVVHSETFPFFKPMKEKGSSFRYDPWRGRGFVQITHEGNYREFAEYSGRDIMSNPDLLISDPELSALSLVWYMGGGYPTNWPKKIPQYIKEGNLLAVRQIVNGGSPGANTTQSGTKRFMEVVQRAKGVITRGIDPNAANMPLPDSYGLGCVDTNGAGVQTVAGGINPNSQGEALAYAIGLHARDRHRTHEFQATIDAANFPEILRLEAQQKFGVKGFGEEFDEKYTCDEVIFTFGGNIEVEVRGYKPDPNAPSPQVFAHGSTANAAASTGGVVGATGSVNKRVYEAAIAAKGKSSRAGPGGGQVACAWAINQFVLPPAKVPQLGSNPNLVDSLEEALKNGRGTLIEPRTASEPGDIIIMGKAVKAHVGIYIGDGKTISNGSSSAAFKWIADFATYDRYYDPNHPCRSYRWIDNEANGYTGPPPSTSSETDSDSDATTEE